MATPHYSVVLLLCLWLCPAQALHGYGHGRRWKTEPIRERRDVTCDTSYPYRSYDGSCNNLVNTEYGMAGATFSRILPAEYENDDNQTPRLTGTDGSDLPSPRSVSVLIHNPGNFTVPNLNQMVMQWAQFLDHDLTHTPTVNTSEKCCYSTELVDPGTLHSDVTTGGPCFPIIINDGDRYFKTLDTRCMEFIRSDPVTDSNGVRQQYNAITPWLDGSQIYGHNEALANSLRSFVDGKMAVKTVNGEDFLPEDAGADEEICFILEANDYCFLAGDHRVNVFPGLTALHTIFVRYHNKICDRLSGRGWTDETLYQEARRIVIAVLQRITYGQFMMQLLGRNNANTYNLLYGDAAYAYDSSVDPTLSNVFSTAAYRFGHSMVTDSLTIGGTIYETGDLYMRPKYVLNSLKDVVESLIDESLQRTDRWYSLGITDRMFEKPGETQSGFDIVARNIQRGRDHGLPSYNEWRDQYGLVRKTFETMDTAAGLYPLVYNSVDDIDLYSGGVGENPHNGARVGELYVKILGEQFKKLKFGDRFWFENTADSTSFTQRQVRQIRRMSLARVICDTVDGITTIPSNVFQLDETGNTAVDCSTILDLNIDEF